MSDEVPSSPRAERVVAVVRWLLLLALALLAAWSVTRFSTARDGGEVRAGRYFCPMHPEVRADAPGECPICHMSLVLATEAPAESPAAQDAGVSRPREVMLSLDQVQRSGVVTERATRVTLVEPVHSSAVIEATEGALSEVHVRAAGFVERVAVRETGVRVARGEALAWVYSPQIFQVQQELLTALRWGDRAADAGHMGSTVEAARTSLGLLGMSAGDIETVERTRTALRAVAVRASAGGVVTRRGAVLGMYATPEAVLYELTDLSRVWAVASVYERDMATVRRGATGRFTAGGIARDARVELIEPRVSTETRTARVRLVLDNRDGALRPGQFGAVDFDRAAGVDSVAVSRDAVVDTGRARYVFVDRGGGRFEPRNVVLGRESGGRVEVLEGLREGERVVVRGGFLLDSESRLSAAQREVDVDGGPAAGGAR